MLTWTISLQDCYRLLKAVFNQYSAECWKLSELSRKMFCFESHFTSQDDSLLIRCSRLFQIFKLPSKRQRTWLHWSQLVPAALSYSSNHSEQSLLNGIFTQTLTDSPHWLTAAWQPGGLLGENLLIAMATGTGYDGDSINYFSIGSDRGWRPVGQQWRTNSN